MDNIPSQFICDMTQEFIWSINFDEACEKIRQKYPNLTEDELEKFNKYCKEFIRSFELFRSDYVITECQKYNSLKG